MHVASRPFRHSTVSVLFAVADDVKRLDPAAGEENSERGEQPKQKDRQHIYDGYHNNIKKYKEIADKNQGGVCKRRP